MQNLYSMYVYIFTVNLMFLSLVSVPSASLFCVGIQKPSLLLNGYHTIVWLIHKGLYLRTAYYTVYKTYTIYWNEWWVCE